MLISWIATNREILLQGTTLKNVIMQFLLQNKVLSYAVYCFIHS